MLIYLRGLFRTDFYQGTLIVLPILAFFVVRRFEGPIRFPTKPLSIGLLAASVVLVLVGGFLPSAWLGSVSFFLLALSFLITHGIGYLAIPLLAIIRLPLGYDAFANANVQAMTSRVSSYVLDLFRVPNLSTFNSLELADRSLPFAEYCGWLQSVFVLIAIGFLIGTWFRRPFAMFPLYVVLAAISSVLCDSIRIVVVAIAWSFSETDLGSGTNFTVLAIATTLLAIGLMVSADAMLQVFFHPVIDEQELGLNPFIAAWDWLFGVRNVSSRSMYGEESYVRTKSDPAICSLAALNPMTRNAIFGLALLGFVSLVPLAANPIVVLDAIPQDVDSIPEVDDLENSKPDEAAEVGVPVSDAVDDV